MGNSSTRISATTNNEEAFRDAHSPQKMDADTQLIVSRDSSCQTEQTTIKKMKTKPWSATRLLGLLILLSFISYAALCAGVMYSDLVQSVLVYMHVIHIPFTHLGDLLSYGLPGARNIEIKTEDGLTLRGWHLLPAGKDTHDAIRTEKDKLDEYFDRKLATSKRVLVYFHGNTDNRAFPYRVNFIRHVSAQLGAHVISFDYRGFGDSEGWPSEEGTLIDASAVVSWINDRVLQYSEGLSVGYVDNGNTCPANWKKKRSKNKAKRNETEIEQPHLFFYGHSLGSAIGSAMAHHMAKSYPSKLTGMILDCPFTTVPEASLSHPISAIFRVFPFVKNMLKEKIMFRYPTIDRIGHLNVPTMIFHAINDNKIPVEHSRRLYQSAVKIQLAKSPEGAALDTDHEIRLREVPRADHGNVFHSHEWLIDMLDFMEKAENWTAQVRNKHFRQVCNADSKSET